MTQSLNVNLTISVPYDVAVQIGKFQKEYKSRSAFILEAIQEKIAKEKK